MALPVTIISGYLGVGKTTLVNHLLRQADGKRLMVLVNDFGTLPIDADLIENADGDTINLSNGCACCSVGGDLFNALVNILDAPSLPDHLLIEASGVADPEKIANIARAEADLYLNRIITLVDAESFSTLVDDPLIKATIIDQIRVSDMILLNKTDLTSKLNRYETKIKLEEFSPFAEIIETQHANIKNNIIFSNKNRPNKNITNISDMHQHSDIYDKWSFQSDIPMDKIQLEKKIIQLSGNILRLKGFVRFCDSEDIYVIHYAGSRYTITKWAGAIDKYQPCNKLIAIGLKGKINLEQLDEIFNVYLES